MNKTMFDKEYLTEELNRKSLFLRMWKKCLLLPVFVLLGAALAFLLYTVAAKTADAEEYLSVSKLYIDFAKDGEGNEADYYNGATWTDLLTAHPDIFGEIEKQLTAHGLTEADVPGETFYDYVRGYVKAEILSDVRLMTLTVRGPHRDVVQETGDAISAALVAFGDTAKEFEAISLLSSVTEGPVLLQDRSRNAILLGAFLGLMAGAFFLWLLVVLDDSVYIPEDAERKYGLPVLGITLRDEKRETEEVLPQTLVREMEENLNYLFVRTEGKAAVISPEGPAKAERLLRMLPAQSERFFAADAADYETLRAAGRVILAVPYGKKNAALIDHLMSQLEKQGAPVRALFIQDADGGFLSRYYGLRKGKNG